MNILTLQISEDEVKKIIAQMGFQYQVAIVFALLAVIAAVAIVIAWVVYEKYFTPQESKDIRQAFRKKFPLCMLGGDDGFADFKPAAFSGPEGILETKSVGRTQEHYTGALPRPKQFKAEEINVDTTNKKDPEKTVAVANHISMLANRRLLLRGARVPVWFAYRGKAVLTSLYALVALQILEGLSKMPELKDAFAVVDVVAIKALFSEQWNESQINAQESDKERKGELKSKKFGGKESLIMMFAIMIILVVVLIMLLVVAYYFK